MSADRSALESAGAARIGGAATLEELRAVEAEVLGKRSALADMTQRLRELDGDERRKRGQEINEIRARLQAAADARRTEVEETERSARLRAEGMDLTEVLPGHGRGHLHLVTQTQAELEDVFLGMGFLVAEGPEVESDWNNFEALNMPPAHPARGMWDTLYVRLNEPESTMLRTHTSPVQIRVMQSQPPPIYIVAPGRCYRRDTPDARHLPTFHQIERLVVDHGITFGELAETIDDLGLIVDALERIGEGLGDVVVSRVLEIRPIPKADKIRQVLVDAGGGQTVEVVCGAWNFSVGDLVPLAPVGAVLPGGFEITQRRMRGVTSNGMICSGRALRLSDDHEGILVLAPGPRVEPGVPLVEALGIQADVVYDLDITPNRPDALSIAGVARDVAARLRVPFTLPAPLVAESGPSASTMASVTVDAPELCPRFTGRVLTGVVVGDSPPWLVRRLTMAGMRPINSVVDASNYVMLELGQPTHPYDLDLLPGPGLLVREAAPGEIVVTLDGLERRVGGVPAQPAADCLICDATGAPVGIGGIMGGASSEISRQTSRVLLEAAYFSPMAIASTSKRLGLRTEASVRFERGRDPAGIEGGVRRFCQLVVGVGSLLR